MQRKRGVSFELDSFKIKNKMSSFDNQSKSEKLIYEEKKVKKQKHFQTISSNYFSSLSKKSILKLLTMVNILAGIAVISIAPNLT
jgi:hypothetical protein